MHRTGQTVAGGRDVDQLAGGVVRVWIHLVERRPSVPAEDRQPVVDVGAAGLGQKGARKGDRGKIQVGGILGRLRVRQDRDPPRLDVLGGNAVLLPRRPNRAGRRICRASPTAPAIRRVDELGEADRYFTELVLLDCVGQVDRPEVGQHDTHATCAHGVFHIQAPSICRRLAGRRRAVIRATMR